MSDKCRTAVCRYGRTADQEIVRSARCSKLQTAEAYTRTHARGEDASLPPYPSRRRDLRLFRDSRRFLDPFFSLSSFSIPREHPLAAFSHGDDSLEARFDITDTTNSRYRYSVAGFSLGSQRETARIIGSHPVRIASSRLSRFSLRDSLEFAWWISDDSQDSFHRGTARSAKLEALRARARARSAVYFGTADPSRITRDRTRPRIGSKSWSYRGVTRFHPRIPRMLLAALGRLRGMSGSSRQQRASSEMRRSESAVAKVAIALETSRSRGIIPQSPGMRAIRRFYSGNRERFTRTFERHADTRR